MNCACMSVGNPGYGAVTHVDARSGRSRVRGSDRPSSRRSRRHSRSFSSTASSVLGAALRDRTSPPVSRPRGEERPGLDAVRHDRVRRAVQPLDALDHDAVGAGARDPRAHRDRGNGEVDDLGLARGVLEHGRAVGEHRRHHEVLGARHGDESNTNRAPLQPARARVDVAVLEIDLGAHRLQALDVLVHGPQADRAAAGQRHARLAAARDAAGPAPGSTRASS